MNKSLIQITNEFLELDRLLIESGGELNEEIETALALNQKDLQVKVDKYKLYMDHLKQRAEYFKDLEAEARDARKVFENSSDKLKDRIKYMMNLLNVNEIDGETFRFKLIEGKDKLVVEDQTIVPQEYFIPVTTMNLDKEKLLQDLQSGLKIEGVDIEVIKTLRTYLKK
jgi:hypothetical protein